MKKTHSRNRSTIVMKFLTFISTNCAASNNLAFLRAMQFFPSCFSPGAFLPPLPGFF